MGLFVLALVGQALDLATYAPANERGSIVLTLGPLLAIGVKVAAIGIIAALWIIAPTVRMRASASTGLLFNRALTGVLLVSGALGFIGFASNL